MAIVAPAFARYGGWLALLWLGLVALAAVLAPVLPLPYAPGVPDLAHLSQPPLGPGQHWLGTDPQGRDVLSELVFGARTAFLLTLPATLAAALVGAALGGAAGFWGNKFRLSVAYWLLAAGGAWGALAMPLPWVGWSVLALGMAAWWFRRELPAWAVPLDSAVTGVAATLDTIPRLVLVVALAAGAGGVSVWGLLALLAFTTWPHHARQVRAQMLRIRTLPFIEATQALGLPTWQIWARHAIPHAIRPLRTSLPLSLAGLLALESTLSFLGIGLPPNIASWGRLLATIRTEPSAWWTLAFPALCLIMSILSLNALSRWQPSRQ